MAEKDILALARNKPYRGLDFINGVTAGFIELHGDRLFGDDAAVVAGIAYLGDMPVTVIAHEKGGTTKEKVARNFGCAHPEGYRKAIRQIKLAEKFKRPIICFVDTQGAYCGIGAEERGQGNAIAECIMELSAAKTPVVSVLIGEGGSGGALAFASGDRVWMLENSIYSVISPEGCASILWKDASKTAEAAHCLKITSSDLLSFGLVEKVIPESGHDSPEDLYRLLASELTACIGALNALSTDELMEKRYLRYRSIGDGDVRGSN